MSCHTWMDLYSANPGNAQPAPPPGGTHAAIGCYPAGTAVRGAVMVCPGGGYQNLAEHEGPVIAKWLNSLGIHAFVLRYRHAPAHRYPVPLEDARRGMRVIRHGSSQGWWPVDAAKVAVMGFSAGGHLAGLLATDAAKPPAAPADPLDALPARPDAQILCYPVIHMVKTDAHVGSRTNLFGGQTPVAVAASLEVDGRATAAAPPAFLFHTSDDKAVPPSNSLTYAVTLIRLGVSVDLHCFSSDRGHGVGLALDNPWLSQWPPLLAAWLKKLGW